MSDYIKRISFEQLVDYWREVDHFKDPNKRYAEIINTLGPFTTPFKDPRRIGYGLYRNDELIGVTQLVHWDNKDVRYRTINIRGNYRGEDLGWRLLYSAWHADWTDYDSLIGWIRDTHYDWSKSHGFVESSEWHDDHILMKRDMND